MDPLLLPFLTYAVVTTFTPGPNNISASAAGMRVGYRRSLPLLAGMFAGFVTIMLVAGLLTLLASTAWQGVVPWLKWVGVAYMAWLIVSLFLPAGHGAGPKGLADPRFIDGLLLQLVNVKVILYGITMYSSFHALLAGSLPRLGASAAFLAALGFTSVSLWALTGAAISRFLTSPRARLLFNLAMAALLAYSAVEIVLN